MSPRVLVVDDQTDVREGLCTLLEHDGDIRVVGEAGNGEHAVRLSARLRPDVVLMDIRMPGKDGITATSTILRTPQDPPVRVIVLTTFDLDEYVFTALRHGASGFLTKNVAPQELRRAVRVVADGHALLDPAVTRRVIEHFTPADRRLPNRLAVLTTREREVARLIAAGLSNDEIARELVLSVWTVKTHVTRILTKLGLRERAQVVIAAYESGEVIPGVDSSGAGG
jgi:DNA-binding NarL/FixJ family response regulator